MLLLSLALDRVMETEGVAPCIAQMVEGLGGGDEA
jgi:hypothetical protein